MKPTLIVLLAGTFSFYRVPAQSLTLDQLLGLYSCRLSEATEFLDNKGYSFIEKKEMKEGNRSYEWGFDYDKVQARASSYISLSYIGETQLQSELIFQVPNKDNYMDMLSEMKRLRFKGKPARAKGNHIYTLYRNEFYSIKVDQVFGDNDLHYCLYLYSNPIYKILFE